MCKRNRIPRISEKLFLCLKRQLLSTSNLNQRHHYVHFDDCVRDYGPMYNYSTFSFESAIGLFFLNFFFQSSISLFKTASFSRTIHGPSTVLAELTKNIDIMRQSSLIVSSSTFPLSGKLYVERINSSRRQALPTSLNSVAKIRFHSKIVAPVPDTISHLLNSYHSNVSLYRTMFLDDVRFNSHDFTSFQRSSDACLLYESTEDNYSIGFVQCVAHLIDANEICLILTEVLVSSTADTLNVNGHTLRCNNILMGSINPSSTLMIRPSQIIHKLAFRPYSNNTRSQQDTFIFFQYPNVKECT